MRQEKKNLNFIFDLITEIKTFHTPQQIQDLLISVCTQFGMTSFGISGIPLPGEKMHPYFMMNGWKEEWQQRYMDGDYVHCDPIIRRVQNCVDPFTWQDAVEKKKLSAQAQRVMNEARDFAMLQGFTIPIHSMRGHQAVVTFGTDKYHLTVKDEAALHMIAIYAHAQLRAIMLNNNNPILRRNAEALTPRERECIKWSSEGKTYDDIATILGISQKMVETHMYRASIKMLTCDKAHLVAESIRCGIIT